MKHIIEGIARFRSQVYPQKRKMFETLAREQHPSALMISCGDSRVDMQLVTQCEPGHLFFFRNAGNIVPPYGEALGSASATIEFAMIALQIPNIIICGHSDCGAMRGVLSQNLAERMPTVAEWLRFSEGAHQMVMRESELNPAERLERLIELNVLTQLEHLKTHPSVAKRLEKGEVTLHGWVYDIEHGSVSAYNTTTQRFAPLEQIEEYTGELTRPAASEARP
jgi:carbonic anhydrase